MKGHVVRLCTVADLEGIDAYGCFIPPGWKVLTKGHALPFPGLQHNTTFLRRKRHKFTSQPPIHPTLKFSRSAPVLNAGCQATRETQQMCKEIWFHPSKQMK